MALGTTTNQITDYYFLFFVLIIYFKIVYFTCKKTAKSRKIMAVLHKPVNYFHSFCFLSCSVTHSLSR